MEPFAPLLRILLDLAVLVGIVWLVRRFGFSAQRRVQKLATNWPVTAGTVEHASPKMMGEGRSGYWVGELSYSYSVDGEYYAGVTLLPARDEDDAYEAVRGWKDRKVQIRYVAANPGQSVLIVDEQSAPIASHDVGSLKGS